jgi:hypothetical protein
VNVHLLHWTTLSLSCFLSLSGAIWISATSWPGYIVIRFPTASAISRYPVYPSAGIPFVIPARPTNLSESTTRLKLAIAQTQHQHLTSRPQKKSKKLNDMGVYLITSDRSGWSEDVAFRKWSPTFKALLC